MKLAIEITPKGGLCASAELPPSVLRVLVPLLAGGLAWPWLIQLAQALGWM